MKVVFAHDSRFIRTNDNEFYSKGGFPYRVWQRYLTIFDHVCVAGRIGNLEENMQTKLVKSSGSNVSFQAIPNLSDVIRRTRNKIDAKRILKNLLLESDALIARIPSEIGILAVQTAKYLGKPYALEVVGCPWDAYIQHGSWLGKLIAPVAYYRMKHIVSKSLFTLYVTDQFLQRRYPSSGRVVAVSNVEIEINDPEIIEKRRLKILDENRLRRIGLIGTMKTHYKGIDTAIQALGIVNKHFTNFSLEVVGDGDTSYYRRLAERASISSKVKFHGILSKENVFEWLDDIDIYIQPSKAEGLPRALIEAMSRACPAVGSTVGGIPELLTSTMIHKPGDSNKLADLLLALLNKTNLMEDQARINFLKAAEYDKKKIDAIRNEHYHSFHKHIKNMNIYD